MTLIYHSIVRTFSVDEKLLMCKRLEQKYSVKNLVGTDKRDILASSKILRSVD